MRRVFFLSIFIYLSLNLSSPEICLSSRGFLEFSLILEKNDFTTKEPINANFKLVNKGKNPIYVNRRFYVGAEDMPREKRDVYLVVISPSGEKLSCKYRYETGLPKTDFFLLLKPGEEVVSEWKRDLRNYFDFSKPGEYKLTAVYENSYGSEIGLETFKGKITSGTVTIKVRE